MFPPQYGKLHVRPLLRHLRGNFGYVAVVVECLSVYKPIRKLFAFVVVNFHANNALIPMGHKDSSHAIPALAVKVG